MDKVYVYVYVVVGNRPTLLGRDIVSLKVRLGKC